MAIVEYTPAEVLELLARHAFTPLEATVANIYPHRLRSRLIQALRPKLWREHIFVMARQG